MAACFLKNKTMCGGLTLAGRQVPTKATLSQPSSAGQGRENIIKIFHSIPFHSIPFHSILFYYFPKSVMKEKFCFPGIHQFGNKLRDTFLLPVIKQCFCNDVL